MIPTTVLEVIEAVDQKLSSEDKWMKGFFAKNANGYNCYSTDPSAVKYCLVGAIDSVLNLLSEEYSELRRQTALLLGEIIPASCISVWNDNPERTFQEVKTLLNLAKEKAKENV